jgi:hypothetical protein
MALNHVFLTRFNLPSAGFESIVRAQDGWLRGRAQLFEEYCLPSVRSQTNNNFHWIIYFDPESPTWLKERISDWSQNGIFQPIFREAVSHNELIEDIRSVIGTPAPDLLTTNLDNDDGIASDFVQRLQDAAGRSGRCAIYIARGLIKFGPAIYIRTDRQNAFCSVRESWDAPVGCWTDFHNLLAKHMQVHVLDGPPGWLQVIHGSNVSNRVRGKRVSPGGYRALFPGLLKDVKETTSWDLLQDRLLASPRRLIREIARATIKIIVARSLGRGGAEHVKFVYASWIKKVLGAKTQAN